LSVGKAGFHLSSFFFSLGSWLLVLN